MNPMHPSLKRKSDSRLMTLVLVVLVCLPALADELKPDPREFFTKRVQPILAAKCWACHTDSKLGGLRLDSLEHVLKGGKSGPAVVPGNPDGSLLIKAIDYTHERLKMP